MVIKYIEIYYENLKFIKTYALKQVKTILGTIYSQEKRKKNVKKCNDAVLNHNWKISCSPHCTTVQAPLVAV